MQAGQMSSAELSLKRWPSGEALVSVADAVALLLPMAQRLVLDLKPLVSPPPVLPAESRGWQAVRRQAGPSTLQRAEGVQMLAGAPQDTDELAAGVVQLVADLGCSQCLVWCKEDALIERLRQLQPSLLLGYVSMPDSEGKMRALAKPPLRLQFPGVRTGPCEAMCSATCCSSPMHGTAVGTLRRQCGLLMRQLQWPCALLATQRAPGMLWHVSLPAAAGPCTGSLCWPPPGTGCRLTPALPVAGAGPALVPRHARACGPGARAGAAGVRLDHQ